MNRSIDLMNKKEEETKKILLDIEKNSLKFSKPKLVLIGGYALRHFIKFPRYTRDCDFISRENIKEVKKIISSNYSIESELSEKGFGFMKCVKILKMKGKKIKLSIDFMSGEIRGREKKEIILIDEKMINDSIEVNIKVFDEKIRFFVPAITDYLIMKIVSGRSSDIRDIASIVLENKIPKNIKKRAKEILPYPEIFETKIEKVIMPEIKKLFFLNSWRGIFATTKYKEEDKEEVLKILKKLL